MNWLDIIRVVIAQTGRITDGLAVLFWTITIPIYGGYVLIATFLKLIGINL